MFTHREKFHFMPRDGEGAPPAPPAAPAAPVSNAVPYDRFADVTQQRNAEKERADALQRQLDEKNAEGQSELQKAIQRAERAESQVASLSTENVNLRRDTLVRGMAGEAIDADAVAALLATGTYGAVDVEKPDTITAALEALKTAKPTLFTKQGEGAAAPQPFGNVNNGQTPPPAQNQQQGEPATERESMGRGILSLLNPAAKG